MKVMSSRKGRLAAAVAGVLVTGLAVTGCGATLAGSAAVIGDGRITDNNLTEEVQAVTSALNIPASDRVNQVILDRLIRRDLFNEMAAQQGVEISQGELDTFIADTAKQIGGQSQLEQQLLQSGVPSSSIQSFAMTFMQQQAIAEKIAPGKTPQEQGQALGLAAMETARALDIRVSPRFGVWDNENLSVGPTPNDLSAPVPTTGQQGLQNLPQVQQ